MKQFILNISIKDHDGRVIGTKQVVCYQGLLARAHQDGLRSVKTEIVQAPNKDNGDVAIVRAVVVTMRGSFDGIGDASPINVNARVAGHLLRVAETRAKARALRDAVNIGIVALEELGDIDEIDAVEPVEDPTVGSSAAPIAPVELDLMTSAQRRLLFRIAAERGVATDDIVMWLEGHVDKKPLKTLGKFEASRLIERLKANGHGASS